MNKHKLITKEEHIEILKDLAKDIEGGKVDFTPEEYEYIHECLMRMTMKLEFGG